VRAVACPFFFPHERAFNIQWNFPSRLPLGAGFCGTCRAGGAEVNPSDTELREFCNLGYSGQCARMPAERRADCVRFAVANDQGARILLHFVYERDHAPVKWGVLDYDAAGQRWNSAMSDRILQRQAECYLAIYFEMRPRAAVSQAAS
jgi:hypothetical protein